MAENRRLHYFDYDEFIGNNSGINGYLMSHLLSLDTSLRHVVKKFEYLDEEIRKAKEKCHKGDRLNDEQSAAIYLYTMEIKSGSVYSTINRCLRSNNLAAAKYWFPYMKLLHTALSNLPSFGGSVWRGVRGQVAKKYRKDSIITWWSFTSCTKTLGTIKTFLPKDGEGTIFMVECLNGKEVSKYSEYSNENEILLLPEIKLTVVDEGLDLFGIKVVHLKEVKTAVNTDREASSIQRISHPLPPTEKKSLPGHTEVENRKSETVNCPHCSSANFWNDAGLCQGGKTPCYKCKKPFQHVTCPNCAETNIWKNLDYCPGNAVPCWNCKKKFQHINCPHCSRANFWENADHLQGEEISCYHCKEAFQHVICPNCTEANIWKNLGYCQGNAVPCWKCKKQFQHINCPYCSRANFWKKAERLQGSRTPCYSCKREFQVLNCAHCSQPNIWKDDKYQEGDVVPCWSCKKPFQHINCSQCGKANYWKNVDHHVGTRVDCYACKKKL